MASQTWPIDTSTEPAGAVETTNASLRHQIHKLFPPPPKVGVVVGVEVRDEDLVRDSSNLLD